MAVVTALIRGLARLGDRDDDRGPETRRARKHFGTLLAAMLEAEPDPALAGHLERVMAARGIRPSWANARARDVARSAL